jgi:hypothetical protein
MRNAVYFFAEYPIEFAMWSGLANIIREVRPDIPLVLIYTKEKNSSDYMWDSILERFDHVHEVTNVTWAGNWRTGLTGRNVLRTLTKGFYSARKVAAELRNIKFQPNSVAFLYNGMTLNQMLFLKRVKSEKETDSVLIAQNIDNSLLSDYIVNYSQSYFFNLYSHFYGTAYSDIYWMRTEGYRANRREFRFRTKPADFVFNGIHASSRLSLKPGQVFFPFYAKDRPAAGTTESVVLFGTIFEWEPSLNADLCYQRYNELINMIRIKHPKARLIYKPHPGQTAERRAREDLKGFDIEPSLGSEVLVLKDPSISTAYSFSSTSVLTSACLGVKSYFLYSLFNDSCIPATLMKQFKEASYSEVHPETNLRSVDDWMNGKNEYDPSDLPERVRASTIKLLELVGIIEKTPESKVQPGTLVTPEERWSQGVHPWPLRRLGSIVR